MSVPVPSVKSPAEPTATPLTPPDKSRSRDGGGGKEDENRWERRRKKNPRAALHHCTHIPVLNPSINTSYAA